MYFNVYHKVQKVIEWDWAEFNNFSDGKYRNRNIPNVQFSINVVFAFLNKFFYLLSKNLINNITCGTFPCIKVDFPVLNIMLEAISAGVV